MNGHLFAFFSLLIAGLVDGLCYTPDGTLSNDVPCNPDAPNSVCCTSGFLCMSNGLCQPKNYPNQDQFIRGTCTDKSWAARECVDFCVAENPSGGEWVMRCANGSAVVDSRWCCSADDCCTTDSTKLTLAEANVTATAGASTSQTTTATTATTTGTTSPTSSSSVTTTSGAQASSPATSSSSSSSDSSLGIGLGVGLGVGGALIAAAIVALIWYRRRDAARDAANQAAAAAAAGQGDTKSQDYYQYYSPQSEYPMPIETHKPVHEMDTSPGAYQLPAGEYRSTAELSGNMPPAQNRM